jgi:hypothetical protein
MAAASSLRCMPVPRYGLATKLQITDQTGVSSTGFMTGERRSFRYSSRGPRLIHPAGSPSE